MNVTRAVRQVSVAVPTMEGAGVRLHRAFGFAQLPHFDPFLLLDDFGSGNPDDYRAGFPWHPHRGIETITYLRAGRVEHGDSLGNRGVIGPGDVQWMTAGSGIIHQEMPAGDADGVNRGFQLWANLPAAQKMCAPRYRDVTAAEIPAVSLPGGVTARIVCGRIGTVQGPVHDIAIEPQYLDVAMPPRSAFTQAVPRGHTLFAYVTDGSVRFASPGGEAVAAGRLVLFGDGDDVTACSDDQPARFLLVSGRPLGEPVAWRGPIVMNSEEELRTAFREYEAGTFLRHERR